MEIDFKKEFYSISPQGNNKVDRIIFKIIPNIDLSNFKCFIKVKDKKDYINKIPSDFINGNNEVIVTWLLSNSITSKKEVEVQLQFESTSLEVWQSPIASLLFSKSIGADKVIEDIKTSLIIENEERISNIEKSIKSVNSVENVEGLKEGLNFFLIKEEN